MKLPFAIVNAFSTSLSGGNPAAIILLTPAQDAELSDKQRIAIARNLNQPMHTFVAPRDDGALGIRWFTGVGENMLCGHATLAAAALFMAEGQSSAMFVSGAEKAKNLDFIGLKNKVLATSLDDGKI
ncbi:unnamed protein product [Peniophora sp. CBMAI 1063]|nr:unnamed protein product [Peniophora sp. CBMAI 1063]